MASQTSASAGSLLRAFFKPGAPACPRTTPHPSPVQILGAINPYCAMLAERAGAKCLYLSGSGVATASHGMPDLGITDLHDVVEDAKRITSATKLPLLVDIDTGFGSAFNIRRTIREMEKAGVAGVHIEDQVQAKRCGHRPNKQIVSKDEMVDRIKMCVASRIDSDFVIMARTDALANEGIEAAVERAKAYVAAGADMLFAEAVTKLDQYAAFHSALPNTPILANMTEFGQTELFTTTQLGEVGVSMVLYPLSAFRAMAAAAMKVYEAILKEGTQKSVVPIMQTRKDLYEVIKYHSYEETLDKLFEKQSEEKEKK